MTKKERESYELMQLEVTLHKAMFVSDLIEPDVPPPLGGEPMTTGWTYNEHSIRVLPACSSSVAHGLDQTDKTTSQRPLALYSTRGLAYHYVVSYHVGMLCTYCSLIGILNYEASASKSYTRHKKGVV